jgi:beta-lactamase superfamily II metal-dependent hydrolase
MGGGGGAAAGDGDGLRHAVLGWTGSTWWRSRCSPVLVPLVLGGVAASLRRVLARPLYALAARLIDAGAAPAVRGRPGCVAVAPGAAAVVVCARAAALALALLPWCPRLRLRARCCGTGVAAGGPGAGELALTLLDTGRGLAVILRTERHALLYDLGESWRTDGAVTTRTVLPALRALRVERIDRLFVPRLDRARSAGVRALLAALPVGELAAGEAGPRPPEFRPCRAGETWEWDGVRFELLADRDCVLRVAVAGGGAVLLTGELDAAGQRELVHRGLARRLQLPRHGTAAGYEPVLRAATRAPWRCVATTAAAGRAGRGGDARGLARRWNRGAHHGRRGGHRAADHPRTRYHSASSCLGALRQMWEIVRAGGPVMWPIILCSVIAVAIVFERLWTLQDRRVLPSDLIPRVQQLIDTNQVNERVVEAIEKSSPLGRVLAVGLANRHRPREIMMDRLEDTGRHVVHELERFLNTLGTIAGVAPLLGLLSTLPASSCLQRHQHQRLGDPRVFPVASPSAGRHGRGLAVATPRDARAARPRRPHRRADGEGRHAARRCALTARARAELATAQTGGHRRGGAATNLRPRQPDMEPEINLIPPSTC